MQKLIPANGKHHKIFAFLGLIAAFSVVGCETPRERREAQREARQAEQQRAEQERIAAEQLVEARDDLHKNIRLYGRLAGEYQGSYSIPLSNGRVVSMQITLRLTLASAPNEAQIAAAEDPAELLRHSQAIALNADIEEVMFPGRERITLCSTPGLRPDFHAGTIRATCTAGRSRGATRNYIFAFDDSTSTSAASILNSLDAMQSQSSVISGHYVADHISQVPAFNVIISQPTGRRGGDHYSRLIKVRSL